MSKRKEKQHSAWIVTVSTIANDGETTIQNVLGQHAVADTADKDAFCAAVKAGKVSRYPKDVLVVAEQYRPRRVDVWAKRVIAKADLSEVEPAAIYSALDELGIDLDSANDACHVVEDKLIHADVAGRKSFWVDGLPFNFEEDARRHGDQIVAISASRSAEKLIDALNGGQTVDPNAAEREGGIKMLMRMLDLDREAAEAKYNELNPS